MTTWTTFETIAESAERSEFALQQFFVDHLGMCQFGRSDDRTRFELSLAPLPTGGTVWACIDLQAEDDQQEFHTGTMKECVQWMAGRVLYGV